MDYQSFQPGGQEQNSVTPPSMESTPQKTITPKLIGVIVGLLVLGGVAYGGIWLWNDKNKEAVVPTFTPRVIDETADWKMYTNTQYGFEFKYPGNYIIEQRPVGLVYVKDPNNPEAIIGIDSDWTANPQNLKIWDWIKNQKWPDQTPIEQQFEKKNLNNVEAYQQKQTGTVYFIGAGRVFMIENGIGLERKIVPGNIFNQILSTFKFTPSTGSGQAGSTDTSAWQTYTNEKYGFEFKYPSDWLAFEYKSPLDIPSQIIIADSTKSQGSSSCKTETDIMQNYYLCPRIAFFSYFEAPSLDDWLSKESISRKDVQIVKVGKFDVVTMLNNLFILYDVSSHRGINMSTNFFDINSDFMQQILSTFKFTK